MLQAMQGLANAAQGQAAARIPPEPESIEDDGLGERDVYKDLKLPSHIDSMMHEHSKFLMDYGKAKTISTNQEFCLHASRCNQAWLQTIESTRRCYKKLLLLQLVPGTMLRRFKEFGIIV